MQQTVVNFVSENSQTFWASMALLLLLGSVAGALIWDRRASIRKYLEHRREVRIERGIEMGRKQRAAREIYLLSLLADIVTNGLEEHWFKGKITPDERNWLYRRVGSRGVNDVVPKKTLAQVKSMIKGRRYRGTPSPAQEHPSWGEPYPRPTKKGDQKPTDAPATNVVNASKRFGDKALKRLKKSAAA